MPDEKLNPAVGLITGRPYERPEEAIAAMFEETNAQARRRVAREEEEAAETESEA